MQLSEVRCRNIAGPRRTLLSSQASRRCMVMAVTAGVLALPGCGTHSLRTDAAAEVVLAASYRNAAAPATPAAGTQHAAEAAGAPAGDSVAQPSAASAQWWRVFESAEMDGLVDRALSNNRDLRIATLQLAQAKIRADQVDADGKPRLSAPLQVATQAPSGQVGAVP